MGSQSLPSSSQELAIRAYRAVKPLPFELREHCTVYFQEELHSQALSLLINLLISGADSPGGHELSVFLPPAQILALSATLVVYPQLTTRLPKGETIKAADEALFYLDHINRLIGASHAGLGEAFQFTSQSLGRSVRRRDRSAYSPENGEEDGRIDTKLTNHESLWSRAEDFWSIVGWAFNCSVKHPARWTRWQLWLDLMVNILNDDLTDRASRQLAQGIDGASDASQDLIGQSLLSQYMRSVGEGRSEKRRVMRAILADGDKKSLNEFGEIWKNETKEVKEQDDSMKNRKKLDFEKDEFADYLDVDDDDDEIATAGTTPGQLRSSTRASGRGRGSAKPQASESEDDAVGGASEAKTIEDFGGMSSVTLRQRLMALLVSYSSVDSSGFMDTEDLFDLYTEFLRPLPLAFFTQFVMPSTPWLEPHSQASLNQMLLRPLISSEAPVYNENSVTQEDLEKHFLPFAANNTSIINNAKVSILVEGLMRLLWGHEELTASGSLRQAVEKGILAREAKSGFDSRKKIGEAKAEEEEATRVLSESSARMKVLLRFIEAG